MTRLTGLLVLAGGLIAMIVWEIANGPRGDITPERVRPPMTTAATQTPKADRTHDWIATVLARPLFSPDRRPATEAETNAGLSGLPRLTGILVGPFGRSAIFANPGRKSIIVGEGGRISIYTVKSIEAAQIRLIGPEGAQVLRPTFEATADKAENATPSPRRLGQGAAPR